MMAKVSRESPNPALEPVNAESWHVLSLVLSLVYEAGECGVN